MLLSEHGLCVPPHAAWIASACAASLAAHTLPVTESRRLCHCQAPPAHQRMRRRCHGACRAVRLHALTTRPAPARSLQRAHSRTATGDALLCRSQLPEQPTCTPKRDAPDARQQPAACCHPPPASGLTGSPWPSCRSPPPSRSRGPRSSCRCCCAASGPACPPRVCLRARVLRPLLDPSIMPCPATLYGWPDLPAARLPARTLALPPPRSCHVLHLLTRRPACPPRAYLLFCSTSPAMSNILTAQQSLPLHA